MTRRILTVVMLFSLAIPAVWASTTQEFMLDNGMKILVKEDHRAPVVVSQVWYKVGSSYEHSGITGISHVLEHMMFKGTQKHPAGEFSRIIAENGGRENAFTSRDYTAYFQQLEKSRLEISFEMEADRMRNLTLPEDEFKKELKVVMEERKQRTEDDPQSLTVEKFYAAAFQNNPYSHPIIGWMNDLENLTVTDLKQWYQRWYAPNNATLVVVGDVDAQQVLTLARKHFANLPTSTIPVLKPRRDATQTGMQKIIVKQPAQLPYLLMGYKVPVAHTAQQQWEPYALEVLAYVLSGGSSSRFSKELVREQQIAAGADTGYSIFARNNELFVIDATPAAGVSIEKLMQAIQQQLQRVKTEAVSAEELQRIKAQVVAGKVYEKDSVFYQAMQLGTLETVGLGWRYGEDYADKIKAVTAEQIMAVAKKYLVEDTLTVAELQPLAQPDKPVATQHVPVKQQSVN